MLSIKAIFDGHKFKLLEKVDISEPKMNLQKMM